MGINALLLCAYGFMVFTTNERKLKTLQLHSSLYEQTSEKEEIRLMEKSIADSVETRKFLASYFVTPTDAVSFIGQIEKLGGYANVDLKIDSVTPPLKSNSPFLLSFSAKGEFDNMYRLFSLIGEMPYRIFVKNMTLTKEISSTDQVSSSDLWDGSFTIVLESYLP